MNKSYYPEKYITNITKQNACTLQIKRQFNVKLNNENLEITYKFNYLSDKNQYILINNIKYNIQIIPDIIQRYLISGGSLSVNSEKSSIGYIFSYINNNPNIEYNNIYTTHIKINNGLRMIYIPKCIKLSHINTYNNENFNTYFHVFSKSKLTGDFNIQLCININYIPFDKEMFIMQPSITNEIEFENNIIQEENEQNEQNEQIEK
jgi:hypothetical protein